MKLSFITIGILTVAALGVGGCAGPVRSTDTFPTPMPLDLPNGIDTGLITAGWDGSYPLRLVAFIMHPIGVGLDLLVLTSRKRAAVPGDLIRRGHRRPPAGATPGAAGAKY